MILEKFHIPEFFETGETRVDDSFEADDAEYEQRLVLIPCYENTVEYAECTDPYRQEFATLQKALEEGSKGSLVDFSDSSYEEMFEEVRLFFEETWVDRNGDIMEEGKKINFCEALSEYGNILKYLEKEFPDGKIEIFSFKRGPKMDKVLLDDVQRRVAQEIIKEYDYDGMLLKISLASDARRKYHTVDVWAPITEEVYDHIVSSICPSRVDYDDLADKYYRLLGSIKLRVADHSYNPANNGAGKFISLTISDNDPTYRKFEGKFNLRYGSSDTSEKILREMNDRIKEIIHIELYREDINTVEF